MTSSENWTPGETCLDAIRAYTEYVKGGEYPACKWQLRVVDWFNEIIENEDIRFDDEQYNKYMRLQKFFPFKLFLWERFCFIAHNCCYRADGQLRFPRLVIMAGRGQGKNGYISFEAFALSTPVNGIPEYNIDIFATSEDQAKTSPDEIRKAIEDSPTLSSRFYTSLELIKNYKTNSIIKFRTSNAKTKDGGRPGMVIFDEYHAYEDYKLINVAKTGLGKKPFPREGIYTTDGNVRGGPFDDLKDECSDILFKGMPDCGTFPFISALDEYEEVFDPRNWHKANLSLRFFKSLQRQIEVEFAAFKRNPGASSDFMTKRMNFPPRATVNDVASWDDICEANRELPDFLEGRECVLAFDYAKTSDFVAAGLLFYVDETYYWISHSWARPESPCFDGIKAPLREWEEKGLMTFVYTNEIDPSVPIEWAERMAEKYSLTVLGMDSFRITLFRSELKKHGFDPDDKNKVLLTKRVTQMRYAPVIQSAFVNHRIVWGDNPLMKWYTNNTYVEIDKDGNMTFAKKEPKYRKTDGFMALVSAFCASASLVENDERELDLDVFGVVSC